VGYLGAPKEIAKACDKIQGQITSATCSIAQKAGYTAVLLDPSATYSMRDTFKKRRDRVLQLMKEIPGLKTNMPDGAFYIFPDITYYIGKSYDGTLIKNATDLCYYLLDNARVALVPGAAFGNDNYLRFSYSAAEDILVEALKRMKESLAHLK
jgi:aspartate aminotransferase